MQEMVGSAGQAPAVAYDTDAYDAAVGARFVAQRARIIRLCAMLTGDPGAAEDLAQEAMLVAWRERDRLRSVEDAGAWLAGIARNLCKRHLRAQGRDRAHLCELLPRDVNDASDADGLPNSLDTLASPDDVADDVVLDLERAELASLLDAALALLPEDSRALLIASELDGTPLGTLARHMGLSEGTLRVRLHRGRLALRQVLASDLREAAVEYGAALPDDDGWRESRIYCPFCGRHCLRYRIDRATGEFSFACAGDCRNTVVGYSRRPDLVASVTSPKSLVARHCLELDHIYRTALRQGYRVCDCGHHIPVQRLTPEILVAHDMMGASDSVPYGIYMWCPVCAGNDGASAWHLALDTAVAQRFWRRHPRMRALPIQLIEYTGRPAIVTGFEDVTSRARIEIVSDSQTYALLHVDASDGA